jgi:ProP effector
METEIKRTSSKDIIAYLTEKFPQCFSIKGPVKPLKIGIFQDLAERLKDDETVSKTRLRQALRHYTSSWRYLKVIKVGAFRIDIDGQNVSEIDDEQAKYASKALKESQEKFGNKKTAKH